MIIYAHYKNRLVYCNVCTKTTGVLRNQKDIDNFLSSSNEVFVGWNCEDDKKRYPNTVFITHCYDKTFVEYCAENGLNCVTNNEWESRCGYEVLYLMEHYEDTIKITVDLFTTVWKKYKLAPKAMRLNDIGLLKEVLGWRE